jgi:hypothetical protein
MAHDGAMSSAAKWWTRATAAVSGAILAMVIPAYAWAASNGVDTLAVEAARGRRNRGIGGFIFGVGGLCCLVVVGGIVLGAVLMMKRRGKRPPQ